MLLNNIVSNQPLLSEIRGLSSQRSNLISNLCKGERKKKIQQSKRICFQYIDTNTQPENGYEAIRTKLEMPVMGIGIEKFFEGKNIFLTGATGLLGKVLVEKILRSTPVGKIYVLVRADDREAAVDRLEKELTMSEIFGCLREKHGKYYQTFIREKLIPVVGNICEPNLGIFDSDAVLAIMEDVNVIIESAANTTLNERYDVLFDTNVNGTQRLMSFAKTCKNLEIFVHISTAYVNGENEGIILENPFPSSVNGLDIAEEMNIIALKSTTASTNYDMNKDMKRLGMERANVYGWYTTYHMTKAMAEMVIRETRGEIPVLIIRPSAIESCCKEPSPGWIQGNRVYDPVIISYGRGKLPAFLGKPDTTMDVIPLDMVVNTTIAAIAKHGSMHISELNVYQLASSVVNPLQFSDFFDYIYDYFASDPLIESETFTRITYFDNLSKMEYFDNFNEFSKYTREEMCRRFGISNEDGAGFKRNQTKLQKQCKATVTYAEQLCKIYEFLGFFKARFHAGNTQKLLSEMSREEQINFDIDVKQINWRKYFQEIHIPGLRKHLLNDKRIGI